MSISGINLAQFDSILEGSEVSYAYEGGFSYQHLTKLCDALSKRYGQEVQWVAQPTSPYGLPHFRISLADPEKPKEPTKGFDYRPFDDLRNGRPVLYEYSKAYYIRHLTQLCKRLSEHYKMRVEWDGTVMYNPDGSIGGFILQPSNTKYPRVLDADLKKFRYELDCYNNQGEIVRVHHGRSPARMPLEWYFYDICLNIRVLGYSNVRIRPSKAARNYFGRPESFVAAFYEAVELVNPEALDGIVAIFPDGDENILVLYRGPRDDNRDDNWGDDWDDDPPQNDPSPDGGIELIVGDTILGRRLVGA